MQFLHRNDEIFFAPSAVRSNSPVAVEQKEDHPPLMANHRSEAGADDRIPPGSPHPGKKNSTKATNNRKNNDQKWVELVASNLYNTHS